MDTGRTASPARGSLELGCEVSEWFEGRLSQLRGRSPQSLRSMSKPGCCRGFPLKHGALSLSRFTPNGAKVLSMAGAGSKLVEQLLRIKLQPILLTGDPFVLRQSQPRLHWGRPGVGCERFRMRKTNQWSGWRLCERLREGQISCAYAPPDGGLSLQV